MPVFKSSRKMQAFGSSLALTLPAMYVKINEVNKGSVMNLIYGLNGVLVASKEEDLEALKKGLKLILEKLDEELIKSKAKKD